MPPIQYPAALCYMKLALGLHRSGMDLEVLCVDPAKYRFPGKTALDNQLAGKIPSSLRMVKISSPETDTLHRFINGNRWLRQVLFPLTEPVKREWINPAVQQLKRMQSSDFEVVLTCSQPHANHLIGLWLKRKMGIPWVAYFSDPWTDNPYWQERSNPILYAYHARLERSVICKADMVLFTSQEMADLVMRKFPSPLQDKVGVLPHAYVSEWYGREINQPEQSGNRKIKLVHIGHFYGPRSPMPLVEALHESRLNEIDVTFIGNMEDSHYQQIQSLGLPQQVHLEPPVPYLSSLQAMRQADWLLLIDAVSTDEPSPFLPSKLVDYLGAGKPILGVTSKNGTSARILKAHGHVVADIENRANVIQALREIAASKPGVQCKASEEYALDNVTALLNNYLSMAIARVRNCGTCARRTS